MRCGFCYAAFEPEVPHRERSLGEADCLKIVEAVAAAGVEKITFAGGEPTLCPWLERVVRAAKRAGMTTMLVTNGTHDLEWALASDHPLDWVALSLDSANPETNRASGRAVNSKPLEVPDYLRLVERLRAAGIRIKLNTVVSRANQHEAMVGLVAAIRPERWKILQVLPVEGQNDADIERFVVSPEAFAAYVDRQRASLDADVTIVPETNDDVRGTYAMIDPAGRFFDNVDGHHRYSRPILEVGITQAWAEVGFFRAGYERRGATYDWAPLVGIRKPARFVAFAGVSGSGKDSAAAALVEQGYRRVAVIDPLKQALADTAGLTHAQLWGDARNDVIPQLGCTPRTLFQVVSDVVCSFVPEFWVERWVERVRAELEAGHRVVCADIRTTRELEMARELGALVIRLERPGAGAPDRTGCHSTETVLAELPKDQFDAVITNDGTLEQLRARVLACSKRS